MAARRLEDGWVEQELPPQVEKTKQVSQGDQVLLGGQGNDASVVSLEITNGEIREVLLVIARNLTTHVNMCLEPSEYCGE